MMTRYHLGQTVEVTAGEEKGQRGVIAGYYPATGKYLVKIKHKGYQENHYHMPRVRAAYLKVTR